ncbi:methylated-DNA--[protein]-cysteine S-methyltransferase [Tenuibacillus multivorans]|uniref:Methylated-DNA--protein-cysteine methyltransferase n=1 Tax=Tenuibacillus multivorans TaxID=237069 RepID=A0A1H0EUL6_9BACI|nr:methylated-DNA--[protein]-cysteine S-methyltransferase [Tenuibacillus multivorans]GEL76950.1 methylated-DNA--protein-cysteine methyltransferase [Tenuibacillus multivorans]SDN85986.1 methylated-DNA-[protein]-cysteine S-methyltransferase [Tenuibacillus multivorans]
MKPLMLTSYNSPIGDIMIGGQDEKVFFIKFGSRDEWVEKWMSKHKIDKTVHDPSAFQQAKDELQAYFNDELSQFSFQTELLGTDFQKRVWQELINIPYGETWTYKDIAEAIKQPKAIRAVGGAINKNPISIAIPCHRVIGSDGTLTGYASGLNNKRFLLHHETKSKDWLHLTS